MKIGNWEYSDYDEYLDEKLEYKKPQYYPEEDKNEKKENEK